MTSGDDKTIVQSDAQKAQMSETSATVGQLSLTQGTGVGAQQPPRAPVPPPTIPDVEIEHEIGRGGMGVVYRGRQPYIDRRVAVKLLLVEKGKGGDEYVKRFQREAKILAGLSHPHIVACYQAGLTADGNPYLVMEFIDGPNLRDHVQQHGVLTPAHAVTTVRDIARALAHANASGIIHRDVKPENVLLAPTGKPGDFPYTAKLVDLGLARPTTKDGTDGSEMNLTMQGMLMGTPATMAPEQFDDPDHVDFRADIYGLGCVLYHALTGTPAFNSRTLGEIVSSKVSGTIPNPSALRATIPRDVCDLVARMLARDRAARPQSYDELIARCDALLGKPSAPASRSSAMWWAGAAMIAVVAGGGLFVATRGPDTAAPSQTATTAASASNPAPTSAPAASAPVFGEPRPLLGSSHNEALAAWTLLPDAQWVPSEDVEEAIAGFKGIVTHPLEAPPWRIEGIMHLGTSLSLGFGVVSANGDAYTVTLQNLTGKLQAKSDLGIFPDKLKADLLGVKPVPQAADVPLRLTMVGDRLEIHLNGIDLNPAQLRSAPTRLYLTVQPAPTAGADPPSVSRLTIRYQKP
ncbi:MAG: serine/threonine protein kinase [Planctomycetes bacterium]|nr:serine/threonine protein kinase [Planctomycetota bacterium]